MLSSGPDVGLNCSKLLPAPPAVFESIVLLHLVSVLVEAVSCQVAERDLHVAHRAVFLLCMPDYLLLPRTNNTPFVCISE